MIAIDTNIVVRFLTGDNAEQSARAQALIDGQQVFLSVTVALETDWVLRSAYGFRPSEVIHALRAFGGLPTVTVEDAEAVARALDMAEAGLDFADALHLTRAAQCRQHWPCPSYRTLKSAVGRPNSPTSSTAPVKLGLEP
jgi:predicted nucleic-acid-binding protein